MSRYIEVDAVIARIAGQMSYEIEVETGNETDCVDLAEELLNDIPSIDIVFCKECKHSEVWESTAGNELYCEKQRVCPYDWGALTAFYVKPDDFCSYGEAKGE